PELARLCGWSGQSRISMYERNERQPSYGDLELIAGALGRPPWFFMTEGYDPVNDRSIARSDTRMTIGQRSRSARQSVRMTQQELADACGLQHQSMVSMYETNQRQPSYEDLKQIAHVLGKPPQYFISENNDSARVGASDDNTGGDTRAIDGACDENIERPDS